MSRLVEEEAVDVVVAVGAVDAASALHAVSRVRAAVKACCAQSVDVRSFVVINSALHCFGDGHCVDTPVGEDAPLPPPSWCASMPPQPSLPLVLTASQPLPSSRAASASASAILTQAGG